MVALACLPSLALADAGGEARAWLERMREAVRDRNYEGIFVYRHQGQLEAMRIIHRADADGEHERLYSLNGAAREIIRDNARVTCILPDDRAVVVDRRQLSNPFAEFVPNDVAGLSAHYDFKVVADGRIAGRAAKAIAISPKDEFRYGYQLWVDKQTGLLLGSSLFNELGESVEQLMFTALSTPEQIPDEWLKPSISGEGFTWYRGHDSQHPQARSEGTPAWRATELPAGFRLIGHEARRMGTADSWEHLLLSDGLATVSVYIEPRGDVAAFTGHSRMGAVNAFGRNEGDYQITVVGEVPAATVAMIGGAIQPAGGGDA